MTGKFRKFENPLALCVVGIFSSHTITQCQPYKHEPLFTCDHLNFTGKPILVIFLQATCNLQRMWKRPFCFNSEPLKRKLEHKKKKKRFCIRYLSCYLLSWCWRHYLFILSLALPSEWTISRMILWARSTGKGTFSWVSSGLWLLPASSKQFFKAASKCSWLLQVWGGCWILWLSHKLQIICGNKAKHCHLKE